MNSFEITTEAQDDLDAIVQYIAAEASPERAIQVLLDLRDAFRKLADMPGMGHFRENLLDRSYRFWTVYSYVIAYQWNVTPIRILAVVHGARDLDALFGHREL